MVRGCAPGSPRTSRSRARSHKLGAMLEHRVRTRTSAPAIEPRLQHLLGLTDRTAPDREDLFSALAALLRAAGRAGTRCSWSSRTSTGPTPALIEFVEYLLDWSRAAPRSSSSRSLVPDVADRHPDLGRGHAQLRPRSRSSRCRDEAIDELLARPRSRAARRRRRADPRPRGRDPAVRRRDGADAARPRPAEPGGPATASPATSTRSTCPRRCTR